MAHTRSASFRVRISVRCGAQKRAGDERVLSAHTLMVRASAGSPKQLGVKLRSHAYAPIAQSVQSRAGCLENLASRGPASAMLHRRPPMRKRPLAAAAAEEAAPKNKAGRPKAKPGLGGAEGATRQLGLAALLGERRQPIAPKR